MATFAMNDSKSARPRHISTVGAVAVALFVASIAFGARYFLSREKTIEPVSVAPSLREFAKRLQRDEKLADRYVDKDGDKLADPPTDTSKLLNPSELAFTVVVADDPIESEKIWKPFIDHLAKATGRPVTYLKELSGKPLRQIDDQIAAVRDGHLHITAFNTGAVPLAVNTAGFHPLFVPADDQGHFDYQMQIIIPADSPISNPTGLKGKTIGLVALSSNSGGRAPLVLLKDKFSLLPGTDYQYVLTGHHTRSITDLAKGEANFDAACVASDILQQMIADKRIDASRLKVIYSSASFPKLTFGVPYNLDPALLAKIVDAFSNFRFAGTSLAEKFAAEHRTRFARIIYSKAFADVLTIDAKLLELYGSAAGR
jgi:phosphonate transport system substrate-binding protein